MKATQKWTYLLLLLLVVGSVGFMWLQAQRKQQKNPKEETRSYTESQSPKRTARDNSIPDKAYKTWEYIQEHHEAPQNHVGGRVFQNREKRLPKTNSRGKKAIYYEWDVNPKRKGQNRGAERLVSEEYTRAWYTPDHYNTFIELNK